MQKQTLVFLFTATRLVDMGWCGGYEEAGAIPESPLAPNDYIYDYDEDYDRMDMEWGCKDEAEKSKINQTKEVIVFTHHEWLDLKRDFIWVTNISVFDNNEYFECVISIFSEYDEISVIIDEFSNDNDLIFDNCFGSGLHLINVSINGKYEKGAYLGSFLSILVGNSVIIDEIALNSSIDLITNAQNDNLEVNVHFDGICSSYPKKFDLVDLLSNEMIHCMGRAQNRSNINIRVRTNRERIFSDCLRDMMYQRNCDIDDTIMYLGYGVM